ncbi:MAG: DNA repair protein RecO [Patescibacteria group bacterium]|jgi:DNA repair protein RecO (recombination protein O)|nr:DNA repair protein RecO [Patescibacteria group bacterium]MDD5172612.1 DNA repair protein RecO [Patescibacteria group bacterium]
MSNTRHLSGIVFKKENYRENDQIIFFYSQEEGKVEILMRGGRKINSKLAPIVAEPFALLDLVVVSGRNNFHLIGGAVKKSFKGIFKSNRKTIQVNNLFRRIDQLIKTQSDQKIFSLILKFLEKINYLSEQKTMFISNAFLIKFLAFLGYCPEIKKCLFCNKIPKGKEIIFSPKKGGIICLKHKLELDTETKGTKISQEVLNILQKLLYRDFDSLINQDFEYKNFLMADKILKEFFYWRLE